MKPTNRADRTVLVTGATGYVGSRLVPRLLREGNPVRCLVRQPEKMRHAPWRQQVDVVPGSVDGPLDAVMDGVKVAVYLVHAIGDGRDWTSREVRDAEHFRAAAEAAGVERMVYLGGMGDDASGLSEHLSSRHEVGRVLAAGPIPVTELRAAVVIGSGSASFEMLRYLVDALPVMVTPKWVTTKTQPIGISDVLHYLAAAINSPEPVPGVFEIGGPDVVSYADMMAIYAEEAGLHRRRLIPIPLLSPRLSSHWVGLVTPVPASLARPLVDSLVNEVVVSDARAIEHFGAPQRSLRESIRLALGVMARQPVVAADGDDDDAASFHASAIDPPWAGGTVFQDVRVIESSASLEALFAAVSSLGGEKGWHQGGWLWRVRGWLDQLWGGPGLRRGRRHPTEVRVGDFVDFWRVAELDAPHFIKLHAEMVLPGDAWLEWRIERRTHGSSVTQRAWYQPRGLGGRAYWYGVAPFHFLVFPGLLRGLRREAESAD